MADYWEFPGGPVVRTQCFDCQGSGLNPARRKKKKKKAYCLTPKLHCVSNT